MTAPTTERDLKHAIVAKAEEQGWNVQQTSQAKPRRPVRRQGRSTAVGYPDLTLARDGKRLWIEVKDERGKVSDDQWRWIIALGEAYVIRPSDWNSGRVAELLR